MRKTNLSFCTLSSTNTVYRSYCTQYTNAHIGHVEIVEVNTKNTNN